MAAKSPEEWITPAAATTLTGLTSSRIYQLAGEGRIASMKQGWRTLVRRSDIEELLHSRLMEAQRKAEELAARLSTQK
jgi:excisionase family DNA binding protein